MGIHGYELLKPMPKKRELPELYKDNYELKAEIDGWNECLWTISGATNEQKNNDTRAQRKADEGRIY